MIVLYCAHNAGVDECSLAKNVTRPPCQMPGTDMVYSGSAYFTSRSTHGTRVGRGVGVAVGRSVGRGVGVAVGRSVGRGLGVAVGRNVGAGLGVGGAVRRGMGGAVRRGVGVG